MVLNSDVTSPNREAKAKLRTDGTTSVTAYRNISRKRAAALTELETSQITISFGF